jgi:hypothetical protein
VAPSQVFSSNNPWPRVDSGLTPGPGYPGPCLGSLACPSALKGNIKEIIKEYRCMCFLNCYFACMYYCLMLFLFAMMCTALNTNMTEFTMVVAPLNATHAVLLCFCTSECSRILPCCRILSCSRILSYCGILSCHRMLYKAWALGRAAGGSAGGLVGRGWYTVIYARTFPCSLRFNAPGRGYVCLNNRVVLHHVESKPHSGNVPRRPPTMTYICSHNVACNRIALPANMQLGFSVIAQFLMRMS